MSLKILVCGDVNGNFDALVKRVNAVNKKVRFHITVIKIFHMLLLLVR